MTLGEVTKTWREGGQFSIEWRIPNFLYLPCTPCAYFCSPTFDCCDAKWLLTIYPKGSSAKAPPDRVDLTLYRLDSSPSKTFNVIMAISGAQGMENRSERWQEFSDNKCSCSWKGFCWRTQLQQHQSKLMPENSLDISVVIRIVQPRAKSDISTQTKITQEDEVATGANKQASEKQDTSMQTEEIEKDEVAASENSTLEKRGIEEWQESMLKMLESGKGSDVVIKVKGKEFPAHRHLLQARSKVFEAMFDHDMAEKQSGEVTIEDCDPETFHDFLKYLYTGCNDVVCAENVFSLYSLSHKYDLNALKEQCADFMKNNLSVPTFCETVGMAFKYDEKELIELTKEFFCANTLDIVKTVEWQTFLPGNSTVGNELFILSYSRKK